jgi:GntR family transcriptional regulator
VASPVDNRSLTERTRDALLQAIWAETFPEGRLPPEGELGLQFGVSRTTVRAALQSLAADGLISRRRRHGTSVNTHLLRASMRLNRLVPYTALIEQCGHTPSVDPPVHRVAPADADAAETLGVEPATDCLVVERLLRASGEPVITVADVIPVERLSVPPDAVVPAESSFAFLAANGPAPVDYATSEFIPRVASDDRPAGLRIARGRAYIEVLETHFSRDHERIAISRVCVDDSLVRLSLLRRDL